MENSIYSIIQFYGIRNSIVHMYHIFTTHLYIEGRLGCLYFLALMNSATLNMAEHVSVE